MQILASQLDDSIHDVCHIEESALNYIGEDLAYSREPSPTKSPLLEIKDEASVEEKLRPESIEPPGAESDNTGETSQATVNG